MYKVPKLETKGEGTSMAMTLAVFMAEHRHKVSKQVKVADCKGCPKPILEGQPAICLGPGRWIHENCYFEILGKEIEEHPIFMPRAVRGT